MSKQYELMPNEVVILKDTNVAHGGIMAGYTDELILTNLNLVVVSKGVFGNTKGIFQYPLSQIKRFNGQPQAIKSKRSNSTPCLEVYFTSGDVEQFSFSGNNKRKIDNWADSIAHIINNENVDTSDAQDDDLLAGQFKDLGDQLKDVGAEVLDAFGVNRKKNSHSSKNQPQKVSKKCISCSAPLVGYKGQVVKCKYCDTEQTL